MAYPLESPKSGPYENLNRFLAGQEFCQRMTTPGAPTGQITHLPWLVPVLGSGALDGVVAWSVDADGLAGSVAEIVSTFAPTPDGSEALETIAKQFVVSLVRSRQRSEARPRHVEPIAAEVVPSSARLALVTALLTRYCHVARALAPSAMQRAPDEEVVVTVPSAISDPYHLDETTRQPLLAQIRIVAGELSDDQKYRYLSGILADIEGGLSADPPRVTLNWVRILTEATWLKLVDGPNEYYGWSEMMLTLLLHENEADAGDIVEPRRRIPRKPMPARPAAVGSRVAEMFLEPTRSSWVDGGSTVHNCLADMLLRQARQSAAHFAKEGQEHTLTQRALALSVTFDMELEMAILRKGSGYHVAIPLHVQRIDEGADLKTAELLWVVGTVPPLPTPAPDDILAHLRSPANWQTLSLAALGESGLSRECPLIVRLSGAPLIDISSAGVKAELSGLARRRFDPKASAPDREPASVASGGVSSGVLAQLSGQKPDAGSSNEPQTPLRLSHAVCVDQHMALRIGQAETIKTTQALGSLATPDLDDLSQAFGVARNPEFFVFLGVPLDDPTVLQRVASVLTVRWMWRSPKGGGQKGVPPKADGTDDARTSGNGAGPDQLRGIAINSRLDLDAAWLLGWLGVSAVSAACRDMIPQIEHYARHVLTDGTSDQHTKIIISDCILD